MSELSKLLESRSPVANPANLANPPPEISRISNFSRGANPNTHLVHHNKLRVLADPSIRSVDMLARELLQKRPDDLRREAGDRWRWISEDPDNLLAFANHAARRKIEASGNVPKEYDGTTRCRKCGPVPFHRGFERRVFNMCPWCFADQAPPPIRRLAHERKAVK